MAIFAGEAAHLVRCDPVEVRLRRTNDTCYAELPINYQNASYFLTPKSRIITDRGTVRTCNRSLPTMFEVDGKWFTIDTVPVRAEPPQTLQPLNIPTWRYSDPGDLARSGIYTERKI